MKRLQKFKKKVALGVFSIRISHYRIVFGVEPCAFIIISPMTFLIVFVKFDYPFISMDFSSSFMGFNGFTFNLLSHCV